MAEKKAKKATKKKAKKVVAPVKAPPSEKVTMHAFQTKAERRVNTIEGPKVAQPGQWVLDMTEGCYVIATDEQVQRLLKK